MMYCQDNGIEELFRGATGDVTPVALLVSRCFN